MNIQVHPFDGKIGHELNLYVGKDEDGDFVVKDKNDRILMYITTHRDMYVFPSIVEEHNLTLRVE